MKTEFGAYELRKQIGKGGMAWVYLAVQRALDRPVAIKILFPQLAEDATFVARFELEARAAARMRHENIVQVYDYGSFEEHPYIAMEFVEGLNLREWLDTHGTPPVDVALVMLRDLCRGLEHAHGRDIVHRDIKPSNVMLTPEGVVKLMDFGLARRAEDQTGLTQHGAMLGTVPYMSTEQSLGERVGKASDIFSLGVVCYEVLGGRRPFEGETPSAITDAILHHEPRPLAGVNPLVPDRLMATIQHMLEKDAEKRCQDIAEVRQVLDELIVENGIFHDRALLADYAGAPEETSENLKRARLKRHLERGAALEKEGPAARAIHEYRCVLHLDPGSKVAKAAIDRLVKEQAAAAPASGSGVAPAAAEGQRDAGGSALAVGAVHSEADDTATRAEPKSPAARRRSTPPGVPAAPGGAPPPGGGTEPAAKPAVVAKPGPAAGPSRRLPGTRAMLFGGSAFLVATVVGLIAYQATRRSPTSRVGSEQAQPPLAVPVPEPDATSAPVAVQQESTITSILLTRMDVTTEPTDATVSVDNGPRKQTPASFDSLQEGMRRVRVVKQGFRTKVQSVRIYAGRDTLVPLVLLPDTVTAGATADAAAAVTPPPGSHDLVVETFPLGAEVSLDGGAGAVSPARFKAVGMGDHTVRVVLGAYRHLETRIAFSSKRDSTMRVALQPDAGAGFLLLRAVPAGDYFVDGALRVANRESTSIAVLPGRRLVEIRNPLLFGEPTRQRERVEAGQARRLFVDFTEGIGFLNVTTVDGAKATVVINGKEQPNPAPGVFPVKCGKSGEFRIRLIREGHETVEGLVTRKVAQRETVDVRFAWK